MQLEQAMKFQLHYFFGDGSHIMDAVVRHRCEGQLLRIIDEISNTLHIPLTPQTEAYTEGGLKEVWTFVKSNPYFLAVATGVLINVLSDKISIDRELINLQKESLRLEIQEKQLNIHKLKKEIDSGEKKVVESITNDVVFILNHNYRAIRSRSEFYKNLQGFHKVTQISSQIFDFQNHPISEPKVVDRNQFKNFILHTDELPKERDESATIDVISPVLKKEKYKWRGVYEGVPIDFYMKDKDFKESIFQQQVSFTNGVSLVCVLEISKKMNEAGEIYISNYSVITVISYSLGEQSVETKQGKRYFKEKEYRKNQLKLFDKE